ncbi:MAG: hypothetical protein HYS21_02460 [Deltaproteobacteria bacterium]|nr:hypothetical protein [Deltaproteobacteria bacterium]
MKRFKSLVILASLCTFAAVGAVQAEMAAIYGPVYISKTKNDGHKKEAKLNFTAPVPGKGVLIVKNGGDSGKHSRVASAEVELNGEDIAKERDFNKNVQTLNYDVTLLADNEMEVKVKSCKECEIEITVMGEQALPTRDPLPLPTRTPVVDPLATAPLP